jgi:hypothetical protein
VLPGQQGLLEQARPEQARLVQEQPARALRGLPCRVRASGEP